MLSEKRRQEILRLLKDREEPITGTDLSKRLGVSRQVIVQDIALIRAQGHEIMATANGYLLPKEKEGKIIKRVVCKHTSYEDMEAELKVFVDMGAKVLDVVIQHPIYGEIRRPLMLNDRIDIEDFMESVKKEKAEPLSALTGGEHIHSIEVKSERAYGRILEELRNKGFLVREV